MLQQLLRFEQPPPGKEDAINVLTAFRRSARVRCRVKERTFWCSKFLCSSSSVNFLGIAFGGVCVSGSSSYSRGAQVKTIRYLFHTKFAISALLGTPFEQNYFPIAVRGQVSDNPDYVIVVPPVRVDWRAAHGAVPSTVSFRWSTLLYLSEADIENRVLVPPDLVAKHWSYLARKTWSKLAVPCFTWPSAACNFSKFDEMGHAAIVANLRGAELAAR